MKPASLGFHGDPINFLFPIANASLVCDGSPIESRRPPGAFLFFHFSYPFQAAVWARSQASQAGKPSPVLAQTGNISMSGFLIFA